MWTVCESNQPHKPVSYVQHVTLHNRHTEFEISTIYWCVWNMAPWGMFVNRLVVKAWRAVHLDKLAIALARQDYFEPLQKYAIWWVMLGLGMLAYSEKGLSFQSYLFPSKQASCGGMYPVCPSPPNQQCILHLASLVLLLWQQEKVHIWWWGGLKHDVYFAPTHHAG